MSRARALPLVAAAWLAGPPSVAAALVPTQTLSEEVEERDEARLLREAAALEARGDLRGAEAVFRSVLEDNPGSSGAVFSLERVLRAQGRARELLPALDGLLARQPTASAARFLKLRVLVEADSLDALQPAVEEWLRADPRSEEPYREGARVLHPTLGPGPATAVLRQGREAVGSPFAFAAELGDLLLEQGDTARAVHEWSLAIGNDGTHLAAVLRRVGALDGDRGAVVGPLVESLGTRPTTPARLRAGVRLAVAAGLEDEAVALARRAASELPAQARQAFVEEVARGAERAAMPRLALWAYRSLRDASGDPAVARALDGRIAAAALAAGDTALAMEVQARLARAFPPGSPERRRAAAAGIRLELDGSDLRDARRLLEEFRREHPDASEVDALSAAVAGALAARGDEAGAAEVLEGVEGPASALERAHLLLGTGQVEEGTAALLRALPGLAPARATEALQMVSLLRHLGAPAARVAGRAAALAHRGQAEDAAELVREEVGKVPPGDRPPLLSLGARLSDLAGQAEDGARLRERLVSEYPDAAETPEALLSLARFRSRQPEGVPAAIRLLEGLLVSRPDSPVAPDARRELQRLRSRGSQEDA